MSLAYASLDALHQDTLREIANIGTGHAAFALGMMTGEPYQMSIPSFGSQAFDAFSSILEEEEALAAAVYMAVAGDAPGHACILFPYPIACGLVDRLLQRPTGETTELSELECSVLMEIGNILAGSFLNALSELTTLRFPVAPPGIAVDMTGAILSSIASISPNLGDHRLSIMTRLSDANNPLAEGLFVYIPEPDSLPTLFHALGLPD